MNDLSDNARRPRVLLLAPTISREATGEDFVAFKWAEALAAYVDLTVCALETGNHTPLADQLPQAHVVTWREPTVFRRSLRLRAMLKPQWPFLAAHVRRLVAKRGIEFDLAHQIMPQAMRHATPFRHAAIPYVIGPLGGALTTPPNFAAEADSDPWFVRLRRFDTLRIRNDPALRASYSRAALVLGVAPYVRSYLEEECSLPLRAYANVLELGVDALAPAQTRQDRKGIRLLHVGRGVRTKGLRDVVRAMALLSDRTDITLTSAGEGPEIEICRQEARQLGVGERCRFLGQLPRAEVEPLYREADIFVFPSFREPAGNVIYEAMRWGLPVIAARRGGPEHIVDERCGIRLEVNTPDQLARDVADAVRRLADDPALRARLGEGARVKIAREGLWPVKAARLADLYREAINRGAIG